MVQAQVLSLGVSDRVRHGDQGRSQNEQNMIILMSDNEESDDGAVEDLVRPTRIVQEYCMHSWVSGFGMVL